MRAFEDMTTVIRFYGTSLRTGDLEAAQKNYMDALVLFEKIGNYRGVRWFAYTVLFFISNSVIQISSYSVIH